MDRFTLVHPSTSLVMKYWNIYEKSDKGETDDYMVPLFEGTASVDIREKNYLTDKNYTHAEGDREIKNFLYNHDIKRFLHRLNGIYSTRVRNLDNLAEDSNWWYCINERILPRMEDVDSFIRYCHDDIKMGCYPYSFATKVYSFLCPEKYPILDSVSVTLLNEYLRDPEDEKYMPRRGWHCYKNYISDYDMFREKYSLSDDLTYKQIDVFLWTYATVISEYWKQMGVLKFKNVEYNPDKS